MSGFVCAEEHPGGDYWVARENSAHAWAEAYDAESGRWLLVENTPAEGIPLNKSQFSWVASMRDRWAHRWGQLLSLLRSGDLTKLIGATVGGIGKWLTDMATRPSVLSVIAILLIYRASRTLSGRVPRRGIDARLRAGFLAIERQLRRHGIRRQTSWTVGRLRSEVDSRLESGRKEPIISLLDEYEALRYRPSALTEEAATRFQERARFTMR